MDNLLFALNIYEKFTIHADTLMAIIITIIIIALLCFSVIKDKKMYFYIECFIMINEINKYEKKTCIT